MRSSLKRSCGLWMVMPAPSSQILRALLTSCEGFRAKNSKVS